jgi:hypothetical protein
MLPWTDTQHLKLISHPSGEPFLSRASQTKASLEEEQLKCPNIPSSLDAIADHHQAVKVNYRWQQKVISTIYQKRSRIK